jgi:hypothetical protein
MRRLILAATLLLAGCGGQGSADLDSGVQGQVTIGPTCPVEQVGAECSPQPYAAQLRIVEAGAGETVTTAGSDSDGRFSVALAPGDYRIESAESAPIPSLAPVPFTVRPGVYTKLTLTFDSGIR